MREPIIIGNKKFKFKKDAILHYRNILNAYNFGESLSSSDYNDLIDLLDYSYDNYLKQLELTMEDNEPIEDDENEIFIQDIRVSKVQFNTKCFEVFYSDNTSQYISYLMILNNKNYTPEDLFNIACRNSITNDIRAVKQEYFDLNSVKGKVKCQETELLSSWTELVVDHRQPNTFSVILDRFKELNNLDLNVIEYTSNDHNQIVFKDISIANRFKKYHKEKANLRIVRSECNSSRTGQARIKRTNKDLSIK